MTNYYPNSIWYHNDVDAFEARMRAEEAERKTPQCICLEMIGDNGDCPVHGKGLEKNQALTFADYKADYQERNDLYVMGNGG